MEISLKKYTENEVNSHLWEAINLSAENSSFLSSIKWINFKRSLGSEIDQYFICGDGIEIGILYIEIVRRRFIKYAYSPYGPVISGKWEVGSGKNETTTDLTSNVEHQTLNGIFSYLKVWMQKYIQEKGLTAFRFDPLLDVSNRRVLEDVGFKKSLAPAQAQDCWVLDLKHESGKSRNAEEILNEIKKDDRYYIRRAEKAGVEIVKATNIEEVKEFGKLMQQVTERKGFGNYNSEYFEKQWSFSKSPTSPFNKGGGEGDSGGFAEIWLAKYQGKYISGALINYYKGTAYYAHGASTSDAEMMKLSSPYLLHWTIAVDALLRDYSRYNFWGAVPKEIKNHFWRGLSDFKMKFPGKLVSYVGPYEIGNSFIKWNFQRALEWWVYRKERY